MKPSLQCVIVLYRETPESSVAYQSLSTAISHATDEFSRIDCLLYDNSPTKVSFPGDYEHHPENIGVSPAYNRGLERCRESGAEWLLLLDQDTTLPEGYLLEVSRAIRDSGDAVAILPQIKSGEQTVSPVKLLFGVPLPRSPIPPGRRWARPFMAINSGAILRRSLLEELCGFSSEFPLEGLDHWWSGEIWKRRRGVILLKSELQHGFSIAGEVSTERYKGILDSEVRLYLSHRRALSRILFLLLLIRRALKYQFLRRNRPFAQLTASAVFKLLSIS